MKREVVALTLALSAISMLATTNASAQSNLGWRKFGVAAGYVSPENLDNTFSYGVFFDHGRLAPHVGLETRLDYWGWDQNSFGIKSSVSDVTLGARTKFQIQSSSPRVRPYLGFGLGMHFLHSEATIVDDGGDPIGTADKSETKLGMDVGGGITTPISPSSDLLGEAWYGIVSDVSQFSVRVGMTFKI